MGSNCSKCRSRGWCPQPNLTTSTHSPMPSQKIEQQEFPLQPLSSQEEHKTDPLRSLFKPDRETLHEFQYYREVLYQKVEKKPLLSPKTLFMMERNKWACFCGSNDSKTQEICGCVRSLGLIDLDDNAEITRISELRAPDNLEDILELESFIRNPGNGVHEETRAFILKELEECLHSKQ